MSRPARIPRSIRLTQLPDIVRAENSVHSVPWAERRAADLAQPASQTMSAMMGADLGHLCALQHGELPREHWRKRLSPCAAQDDRRAG
jgi:hypothetical protein